MANNWKLVLNWNSHETILIIFFRIYEYTDILCVNETEAQIILGQENEIETETDIENAMNLLLVKCQIIVITLGNPKIYITISTFTFVHPSIHQSSFRQTIVFYHVHGSICLIRLLLQLGCPVKTRIPSTKLFQSLHLSVLPTMC